MPREPEPSIGEQLADALETADVSQKELARRLAPADADSPAVESKRRWILKLLRDEVKEPNMAGVEAALNLPAGHFVYPSPEAVERRRVRLGELERRVVEMEQGMNALKKSLEGLSTLPDRVTALEQRDRPRRRRSG